MKKLDLFSTWKTFGIWRNKFDRIWGRLLGNLMDRSKRKKISIWWYWNVFHTKIDFSTQKLTKASFGATSTKKGSSLFFTYHRNHSYKMISSLDTYFEDISSSSMLLVQYSIDWSQLLCPERFVLAFLLKNLHLLQLWNRNIQKDWFFSHLPKAVTTRKHSTRSITMTLVFEAFIWSPG